LFWQARNADQVIPVQTPREYLFAQCEVVGCDADMLDAIATCESQWRMVGNTGSTAFGYYQILDSTERTTAPFKDGQRKFDPYANVDMGIYLYQTRGTNPWHESMGCWKYKYQSARELPPKKRIGVKAV